GASARIVTERTKMAMPETAIGLFPDVGGGYFLSRCPGRAGEWLGLTGDMIGAGDAIALNLADGFVASQQLPALWQALTTQAFADSAAVQQWIDAQLGTAEAHHAGRQGEIDRFFALPDVRSIVAALEAD